MVRASLSTRVWDPGKITYDKLPVSIPKRFVSYVIAAAHEENDASMEDVDSNKHSRTEFDSHANMPLVGKEAYIISETGKTVSVYPYSPEYPPKELPIVDAAVVYESPYNGERYVLVVRNAISVMSMAHNFIPPFIIREAGVQVKEVPKMQCEDPSFEDHAIVFKETVFWIPLGLTGIFSYFLTCKPSLDDMLHKDNVYLLTPSN